MKKFICSNYTRKRYFLSAPFEEEKKTGITSFINRVDMNGMVIAVSTTATAGEGDATAVAEKVAVAAVETITIRNCRNRNSTARYVD